MKKQVTHQIKIGEKIYTKGIHDFPADVMEHEHFKFYSKAGRILTPAGVSSVDKFKTEESNAKRKEIELAYGIPQKPSAAPSSKDVQVEALGDSGYEPKVEAQAEQEEMPVQHKKYKR